MVGGQNELMATTMKPCPFCGRKVSLKMRTEGDKLILDGIWCNYCQSLTSFRVPWKSGDDFRTWEERWITKWNRRG